jgi:hypothetical protein
MNFHIPHSLYAAMVEAQDESSPLSRKYRAAPPQTLPNRPNPIYITPKIVKVKGGNIVFKFSPEDHRRLLAAWQEIENGSALSSKPNHPDSIMQTPIFAVFRQGFYRHECMGIFTTQALAEACMNAARDAEPDKYHAFAVVPFKLNEATPYINGKPNEPEPLTWLKGSAP